MLKQFVIMSGNKSRFPGKSIIKNGKIRPRRSVCHRSKEEMANDSCVNTAKNIAKGLENSTIGDSDEVSLDFIVKFFKFLTFHGSVTG